MVQKIWFLKIWIFEKVIEHFVPKFDSHLAQTDTFRRFRAFGGCVAAKIPRNFFFKSKFQKHFFKPLFLSSEEASNVCSGPGCLVSDISREKIILLIPEKSSKFINLNTFWIIFHYNSIRRSARFWDFPEMRPTLRSSKYFFRKNIFPNFFIFLEDHIKGCRTRVSRAPNSSWARR